jgi:hypothetical protein
MYFRKFVFLVEDVVMFHACFEPNELVNIILVARKNCADLPSIFFWTP